MAAASCLHSEDRFLCSICLDVFTDPVSTSCGHNFCKACITKHWDANDQCLCPLCKEVFTSRPKLHVNTFISGLVAQFRESAEQEASNLMQAEIQERIQRRRLKVQEIKHSVDLSEKNAERKKAEGVEVFTALMASVEKGLKEFFNSIEELQKNKEKLAENFINDLEEEICELEKGNTEVKPDSWSKIILDVPEGVIMTLHMFRHIDFWTKVSVFPVSYEHHVVKALVQLEKTLGEDMKKLLSKAKLKSVQQFAVDVTLDPDTAHPNLILSDDGTQVTHGDVKKKNLQDNNPERFSVSACALGKQSFSSGKFYFEVQVKEKTKWEIGVASKSIERKRIIQLSPQNGYLTIWLRNANEYKALADPPVLLSLKSPPQKVGVFVDYEEGLVSFYDVDTAALIYSFTGCCFHEKLYPFFSPCLNDGGENAAPLVISPVNRTE